jgi:NitT/TauT family transport system substrate-binding protein
MTMASRNPAMKSLRDVTEKDRIAVPGIKTSLGAIILQMAVAKEFGDKDYARLDHLTVSLPYPDAVAAMLSSKTEITAHVASAPFSYMELDSPGIHKVFNSVELFGHVTTIMAFTTEQFRAANPKLTASFVAAPKEAVDFIAANKAEAAQIYVRAARVKSPEADILRIINDPDLRFTLVPEGVMIYANFMHRVGLLKVKPATWKDVFVSELHALPGN